MAMNFGPLFPFMAPLNNTLSSTQMWGGNPFSAAFNGMGANINYPNLLFLPFGATPVNIQPPSNLLQTPGIQGLLSNNNNIFGGSSFIPQNQSFGGPPPFTLDFGAMGNGAQVSTAPIPGFGQPTALANPGIVGVPVQGQLLAPAGGSFVGSTLGAGAAPMIGGGAPIAGASPLMGAAPMLGAAAPGFGAPAAAGGLPAPGGQGGQGGIMQQILGLMMSMMQMMMQLLGQLGGGAR